MKKIIVMIAIVLTTLMSTAHADQTFQFDGMQCSQLAGKYYSNETTMTVRELDEMSLCIKTLSELMAADQNAKQNIRAFDRLYNMTDLSTNNK